MEEEKKQKEDLKFKLEFANHKSEDESQKNQSLVDQLNAMGQALERMKKDH